MALLLWLPLWIGIILIVLALPVARFLPQSALYHRKRSPNDSDADGSSTPLLFSTFSLRQTDLKSTITARLQTTLTILNSPTRNFLLLLALFFLASLASSDTKLLPLYISNRYHWRFASVGYLLSIKAMFNFVYLTLVVPRLLKRQRQNYLHTHQIMSRNSHDEEQSGQDKLTLKNAHLCLVVSVLGALAIAFSLGIVFLLASLLLYALGSALPVFTYSLLRSPSIAPIVVPAQGADADGEEEFDGREDPSVTGAGRQESERHGAQLFSIVMLIRTAGSLLGAMIMPTLWVTGLGAGGTGLGLPFLASAVIYAVASTVVRRIKIEDHAEL